MSVVINNTINQTILQTDDVSTALTVENVMSSEITAQGNMSVNIAQTPTMISEVTAGTSTSVIISSPGIQGPAGADGATGPTGPAGESPPYRSATITRTDGFITEVAYDDGTVNIIRDGNNYISSLTDSTFSPTATLTFTRDAENYITDVVVT